RQALDKATTGDAIFLPANASSYAVTLGEIAYGTDGLTILGAGARQSVIQGNGSSRIFNVGGTTEAIAGVTITGGGGVEPGGGIYISTGSAATLQSDTIAGNTATGKSTSTGGNIYTEDVSSTGSARDTIVAKGSANGTRSSVGSAAGGANCAGAGVITSNGN